MKLPTGEPTSLGVFAKAFKDAILALVMPVIILGGIYGGVFTPAKGSWHLDWAGIPAVKMVRQHHSRFLQRQMLTLAQLGPPPPGRTGQLLPTPASV